MTRSALCVWSCSRAATTSSCCPAWYVHGKSSLTRAVRYQLQLSDSLICMFAWVCYSTFITPVASDHGCSATKLVQVSRVDAALRFQHFDCDNADNNRTDTLLLTSCALFAVCRYPVLRT